MKIYVAHSREIDYLNELYEPLKELNADFIFPHADGKNICNSRDFYKNLDLVIAEVSKPATGLGIELGFLFDAGVPIYCLSKKGSKVSSSLKSVTSNFYEYENREDLKKIVSKILKG